MSRSSGYRTLAILNDLNAVSKGPRAIAFRLLRKQLYKIFMQLLRQLR